MFTLLKELFQLLTPGQRRRFLVLQVLVVIMAIFELLGIASIGPFMGLVTNPKRLQDPGWLNTLFVLSGSPTPEQFLFIVGVGVLVLLTMASVISILTTWRLSTFGFVIGTEIADRLYDYYLNQDWLFHANASSAQLTKQVATESMRLTTAVITPLMNMNARLVLALFISLAIFIYDPVIALAGLLLFFFGYLLVYKVVRRRLIRNGKRISAMSAERFRLMNEGFGGIKDLLLLQRNPYFIKQFHDSGKVLARAQGMNAAFQLTPRYFMELIAFGAMVSLVLVLLKLHDGALDQVVPVLAIYALAGFKLLPALQQTYASLSQIKGNLASFEAIRPDLIASQAMLERKQRARQHATTTSKTKPLPLTDAIRLDEVTFTYPNKRSPALKGLNLVIPANSVVGLVGESGSGKSTAVDLLLALVEPDSGQLQVDDTVITPENRAAWQSNIGFVAQSIFLSEGSIAQNIAFGLAPEHIQSENLHHAIRLAGLQELIDSLPDGVDTPVGERGVQLSGGQRQRIGIARALYHEAQVLVFDEATSALDGITEKFIMDAIHGLGGQKTIILIAHRLKTVEQCDVIYMLDDGQVADQGSYDHLLQTNARFREMARYA